MIKEPTLGDSTGIMISFSLRSFGFLCAHMAAAEIERSIQNTYFQLSVFTQAPSVGGSMNGGNGPNS